MDTALKDKVWNSDGIRSLLSNGVTKILCTSKFVLESLQTRVICSRKDSFGTLDEVTGKGIQEKFLESIGGVPDNVVKDFVKVFRIDNKTIVALAIPSPGSPQRQIARFGCPPEKDNLEFADLFFRGAFEWLKE